MDILLQNHNAKHVCDIPDGLRELCADISREVIRLHPEDIYSFIADYLDSLLITRENTKIAIRFVQSIMLKSEHIVEILSHSGLDLKKIAAAAPRLQKAFRTYLEAVDLQKQECGCDADNSYLNEESELSLCKILKETGASFEKAQRAAIKIQALFRGHYERMLLAERRGEVQWQRAATNTMEILRKTGIDQNEATFAARIIQSAYRGYYTRKNMKLKQGSLKERTSSKKLLDMAAWFDMMFENTGVTIERANKAAITIQKAYKKYRERKSSTKDSLSEKEKSNETGDNIDVSEKKDTNQIETSKDGSQLKPAYVKFEPSDANVAVDNIDGKEKLKNQDDIIANNEKTEKIQDTDTKESIVDDKNQDKEKKEQNEEKSD